MGKSLFDKVWDAHTVRTLPNGQTQLFIGLHLIHEVTSPQAFGMLRDLGLKVPYPAAHLRDRRPHHPDRHAPAAVRRRAGRGDDGRRSSDNCERVRHHASSTARPASRASSTSIGPEQGLTQPGMTIACGDSHTRTHGAFGAIAFGIGTSQVRDVLATQTLALGKLKVRRIEVDGKLGPGVYAKDVILHIIRKLGVERRHRLRLRIRRRRLRRACRWKSA